MLALRTLYFEDLSVGMTERLSKTVASSDVVGFAEVTGDRNPIHLSEHFAAKTPFGTRIAHGLYTASLISAVLGTRLPGPGAPRPTDWREQVEIYSVQTREMFQRHLWLSQVSTIRPPVGASWFGPLSNPWPWPSPPAYTPRRRYPAYQFGRSTSSAAARRTLCCAS